MSLQKYQSAIARFKLTFCWNFPVAGKRVICAATSFVAATVNCLAWIVNLKLNMEINGGYLKRKLVLTSIMLREGFEFF